MLLFSGAFNPNNHMELSDLKAELSVKSLEFEQALDAGLSHSQLIKIYREIKELQYQITVYQVKDLPPAAEIVE